MVFYISVLSGSSKECREKHYVEVSDNTGYLSTAITEQTGFGSTSCPWHITLPAGQRVEFTYYNLQVMMKGPFMVYNFFSLLYNVLLPIQF